MKLKVLVKWDVPTTVPNKCWVTSYPLSTHLQIDLTSSLIVSQLTSHLWLLNLLGFFTVPEHLMVDNHTVYKSLGLVKPNKSFGPERIPGTVWKEFDFELSPISMAIYNASMIQSYVPERLKQSDVVSLPKCSLPKSVEQELCPISLTLHLAKIVEGFTLFSLLNHVCDKLDVYQFALAGNSTTHALVYFLYALLQSLDQCDTYVRVFFADFSLGWTTTFWFKSYSS